MVKILDLFKAQDKVTNNDVEELLGVSDATATNYLDISPNLPSNALVQIRSAVENFCNSIALDNVSPNSYSKNRR